METIKIIITDPYKLFREGIQSLLLNEPDIEFIADAENSITLLNMVSRYNPDVVLMGMNLPEAEIIKNIAILSEDFPYAGIIVLFAKENPHFVYKCMHGGACSYLLKNMDHEELIYAIRNAAMGHKYVTQEIEHLSRLGLAKENNLKKLRVSRREKEILQLVAKGNSTIQMSDELSLSRRTIESHRLRLLNKFEAQNSMELIKMAREGMFID